MTTLSPCSKCGGDRRIEDHKPYHKRQCRVCYKAMSKRCRERFRKRHLLTPRPTKVVRPCPGCGEEPEDLKLGFPYGRIHCRGCFNQLRALWRIKGGQAQKDKRAAAQRDYYARNKNKIKAIVKDWESRNPEKKAAHIKVAHAIRSGQLERLPCERCGSNVRVQAHHDNYRFPLDVTWLCPQHHRERHDELDMMTRLAPAPRSSMPLVPGG